MADIFTIFFSILFIASQDQTGTIFETRHKLLTVKDQIMLSKTQSQDRVTAAQELQTEKIHK